MNNRMRKQQQGIALIAAIFLVVIIGSALVLLATLSTRNSQQTTQSLLQIRAQIAAQAGLEYAVQRLVLAPTNTAWCTGTQSVSIAVYSEFSVNLTCNSNIYNRPSQQITLYRLETTAEYGNQDSADYAWSKLEATVEL